MGQNILARLHRMAFSHIIGTGFFKKDARFFKLKKKILSYSQCWLRSIKIGKYWLANFSICLCIAGSNQQHFGDLFAPHQEVNGLWHDGAQVNCWWIYFFLTMPPFWGHQKDFNEISPPWTVWPEVGIYERKT